MNRYREDPASVRALVRDDAVHRDVYTDPEIFRLEMQRLWPRTWIYVGHTSQIPAAGDFITCDIGTVPVLMIRQPDASVRVLRNRCAHKGAKLVSDWSGNAGRFIRCPYHNWSYRTDGSVAAIPLRQGYDGTGFANCEAVRGLRPVATEIYRGFVFARLSEDGPSFRDYFGESLSSIDYMADRSPEGEMEIAGGVLRYMHDSNWKMFVENLNDTMHPMAAHESSAGTAKELWADKPADAPKPMAIEQLVPFAGSYDFFDKMGVRVFANGHSYSGVHFSIHSSYAAVPDYEAAMQRAYGEERAKDILGTVRHNTVYYPSLTIKGAIQTIRVVRPIAVDRTLIESHSFRLKGAPDIFFKRNVTYTRLINSPMSVVGHDDQQCYRLLQEGLAADGNEWISLHRDYRPEERGAGDLTVNGTSEISMRNQFRAWAQFMGAT
ncbi:MAG TPA: aromatic ring-hydroxylating dioxygenase subunit alpha [Acetobacteraceae bacterium]|nr:aromatic ring-hydroxylating dioxygenase subunit alpha [Acetobacteraceae bacterium]